MAFSDQPPLSTFGVDESLAFLLNNLLISMGALLAFFIPWHLTGRFFLAAMAGLAYALIPHNLLWSQHSRGGTLGRRSHGIRRIESGALSEDPAKQASLLHGVDGSLRLSDASESILIPAWAFAAFLVLAPRALTDKKLWSFGLLTAVFLLPQFLHFYAVSGHSWGAEGNKFSLSFLGHNLETNGLYYLNNRYFPVLITFFAFLGLFRGQGTLRWRLLIAAWFLLFGHFFSFSMREATGMVQMCGLHWSPSCPLP